MFTACDNKMSVSTCVFYASYRRMFFLTSDNKRERDVQKYRTSLTLLGQTSPLFALNFRGLEIARTDAAHYSRKLTFNIRMFLTMVLESERETYKISYLSAHYYWITQYENAGFDLYLLSVVPRYSRKLIFHIRTF